MRYSRLPSRRGRMANRASRAFPRAGSHAHDLHAPGAWRRSVAPPSLQEGGDRAHALREGATALATTGRGAAMASAVIVIPCYNEADRLPVHTFRAFACARPALRFLFVDDGSTDGTWRVLEALHASDP